MEPVSSEVTLKTSMIANPRRAELGEVRHDETRSLSNGSWGESRVPQISLPNKTLVLNSAGNNTYKLGQINVKHPSFFPSLHIHHADPKFTFMEFLLSFRKMRASAFKEMVREIARTWDKYR